METNNFNRYQKDYMEGYREGYRSAETYYTKMLEDAYRGRRAPDPIIVDKNQTIIEEPIGEEECL